MKKLFALALLVTAMTVAGCGEKKKAAPAATPAAAPAAEEAKPAEGAAAPATEAPK